MRLSWILSSSAIGGGRLASIRCCRYSRPLMDAIFATSTMGAFQVMVRWRSVSAGGNTDICDSGLLDSDGASLWHQRAGLALAPPRDDDLSGLELFAVLVQQLQSRDRPMLRVERQHHGLTSGEQVVFAPLAHRNEDESQPVPLLGKVIFAVGAAVG